MGIHKQKLKVYANRLAPYIRHINYETSHIKTTKPTLIMLYILSESLDSVPHIWSIQVLQIYKIYLNLFNFQRNTMNKWKTQINVITYTETITTEQIDRKKGIFLGDSLSAFWFCLCLNGVVYLRGFKN